ncbi:cold-regulated 413 plasma membrane protein 4-like isoform X2 [Populus nigra]|uniref:cold-regulated 413 plasma membrane protein 4-like isoform X2 n=1 Tax=Populus nigra TaxID=3691 RepID=UPI002B2782C8|nr:cold-regulated 413 plasma membrane protein 4-like isoform X2 [Populus nigra]
MASSFNVYNSTSLAVAEAIESRSSRARASFQWGGTIFAIFLLILNRVGRKSSVQTTLLVFYLLTSFPTVLFKVLRGQFGYWIAFLAIAANLFFPEAFPDGLRNSIAGAIFCLLIGISSVIMEIREIAGNRIRECSFLCWGYCLAISFVFFFTINYLCLGTW